jgi:hypothetical protein
MREGGEREGKPLPPNPAIAIYIYLPIFEGYFRFIFGASIEDFAGDYSILP